MVFVQKLNFLNPEEFMATIISPSLLSANFLVLGQQIEQIQKCKNVWLHLDVMDGHFVPNLTFANPLIPQLASFTKTPLDAHFMVTNPDLHLDAFKEVKLHNFTFHWEAVIHHDRFISKAKDIFPSVGVSLNPSTSIDLIPDYLLQKIDLVLLMSVNPGFGGQKFIPSTFDKIKLLHKRKLKLKAKFQIQVDGGVSEKNAKELISVGANNLVMGNALFSGKSPDLFKNITHLQEKIK